MKQYIHSLGVAAVDAAKSLSLASSEAKNQALLSISESLQQNCDLIVATNAKDMQRGKDNNLSSALLDRLELNPERVRAMARSCTQVAKLDDPVGQMTDFKQQPSGIKVAKMRVPLGVIGIIYESRPNVTVEAAALCLKAGNAAILRGGSEAIYSNLSIARCIIQGLKAANLDERCVQVVNTTNRDAVGEIITLSDYISILIPRGGKSLIERISAEATIPVIKHLDGICHVYIDDDADINKALAIAYNAKARRYGICGAMETLLVSKQIAEQVLPDLCRRYQQKGIELRGCERARKIVPILNPATEKDWQTEYLDAILSIRIVDDIHQAIQHIDQYSSHHTDAIVSENKRHQQLFLRQVDSSSVMINTSTQFADGFEYGLGAEIGISTDKLHVRGPVGLEGLTTQKYVVLGDGHIRS